MANRNLLDLMIKARTPSWQRTGQKFTDTFLQALQGGVQRREGEKSLVRRRQAGAEFELGETGQEISDVRTKRGIEKGLAFEEAGLGRVIKDPTLTQSTKDRLALLQGALEAGEYINPDTQEKTVFTTEAEARNFKKKWLGSGIDKKADKIIEPYFNKYKELDKAAKKQVSLGRSKIKYDTTNKRFQAEPGMSGKQLRGLFVEDKGYEVYEKGQLIGYYK